MPTLQALGHDYTRALHAVTVRPSVTVAALASFATGVAPATHGLVEPGLAFLAGLGGLRPLARELGRQCVRTIVAAGSPAARSRPIACALMACAGVDKLILSPGDASEIAERAVADPRPNSFTFVYLPDCDQAGHARGWMSAQYMHAAAAIDTAIATIASQLDDTLLIVLADHGGGGVHPTDHDAPHPDNERIPLVIAGPQVRRHYTLARPVSLLDVPPTILHWFGAPVPEAYEGAPLFDAFEAPVPRGAVA